MALFDNALLYLEFYLKNIIVIFIVIFFFFFEKSSWCNFDKSLKSIFKSINFAENFFFNLTMTKPQPVNLFI